ncbi:MAG: HD family hydrolase [Candidatus Thorarchaeota archaeon]|nr:HD family hydrolase [Candidatus Thorarchaeota archaeon]
MKLESILEFIELGEVLKRIQRTGWLMVGVMPSNSESIAEHSYGTALTALISALALCEEGITVDLAKVLTMAVLHDLPESRISDIPTGENLPGKEELMKGKLIAENESIKEITSALGGSAEKLDSDWKELSEKKSIESRIVHGADAIDMLTHALALERAGMNPDLFSEFFVSTKQRLEALEIRLFVALFERLEQNHLTNIRPRKQP